MKVSILLAAAAVSASLSAAEASAQPILDSQRYLQTLDACPGPYDFAGLTKASCIRGIAHAVSDFAFAQYKTIYSPSMNPLVGMTRARNDMAGNPWIANCEKPLNDIILTRSGSDLEADFQNALGQVTKCLTITEENTKEAGIPLDHPLTYPLARTFLMCYEYQYAEEFGTPDTTKGLGVEACDALARTQEKAAAAQGTIQRLDL